MTNALLLNDHHRQAGATLGTLFDRIVPLRFSDHEAEYRTVRQQAGLIDWSSEGLLKIRGADRAAFLHNLLTNDIKVLTPGTGCPAALLTPTAKLLAEGLVLADDEAHWFLTDGGRMPSVLKTLDHYLITEDVALQDVSARQAIFALQGPQSLALLPSLLDAPVSLPTPFTHLLVTVDSAPIRLIHWSITGEPGVVLVVPAEQAAWLWNRLLERGRPHGVQPVGWETLNTLRIEAGIPWFGLDVDETNLLPETGLERYAVSATKGCYVGQEIVARMQTYGSASRKLMGLVCEGHEVPQANDPILKDGQPLGHITSACFSPAMQQPIAMGSIKRPFYEVGTTVQIVRADQSLAATLVRRPFVRLAST